MVGALDRLVGLDIELLSIMGHDYLVHQNSKRFTALSLVFKPLDIKSEDTILKT